MFNGSKLIKVILALVLVLTAGSETGVAQAAALTQANAPAGDEIQTFLRSYFAARYEAHKTLEAPSLQNIFENVDAKNNLKFSEQEKLEIEIAHARINRLRYAQYELLLDLGNITMKDGQTAVVNVTEGHDVVFELFAPRVSSMRNVQHVITLRSGPNGWRIIADMYEDDFWRFLKQTSRTRQEIIDIFQKAHDERSSNSQGVQTQPQTPRTSAKYVYPYNREGAAAYANLWAFGRNPNYVDFESLGGDCTNFVSQAIKEGGGAMMVFGGNHGKGTPGWYQYTMNDRSSAWNWVGDDYQGLAHFIVNEHYWQVGPEGDFTERRNVGVGDIIQYNRGSDTIWDHSVMIVGTIQGDETVHLVAGHSGDVRNYPDTYYPYERIRYIRINVLRGFKIYDPSTEPVP